MKKVGAWWARIRARRQDDSVERARWLMNEAIQNAENWHAVAEIRTTEFERLSGTKVIPHEGKVPRKVS